MERQIQTIDRVQISAGAFWAILDATGTPAVPRQMAEPGVEAVSLYRGSAEEEMWDIAPYLVRLNLDLLIWIEEDLADEPWGIALRSEASLEELRRHFRKFLLVKTPDGKQVYFRFYDPRVLAAFLPTCKEAELKEFFGPVEEFWIKTTDPETFEVFRR